MPRDDQQPAGLVGGERHRLWNGVGRKREAARLGPMMDAAPRGIDEVHTARSIGHEAVDGGEAGGEFFDYKCPFRMGGRGFMPRLLADATFMSGHKAPPTL